MVAKAKENERIHRQTKEEAEERQLSRSGSPSAPTPQAPSSAARSTNSKSREIQKDMNKYETKTSTKPPSPSLAHMCTIVLFKARFTCMLQSIQAHASNRCLGLDRASVCLGKKAWSNRKSLLPVDKAVSFLMVLYRWLAELAYGPLRTIAYGITEKNGFAFYSRDIQLFYWQMVRTDVGASREDQRFAAPG